jgi:hypothetical protein
LALQSVCAMVGPRMRGLRNIIPESQKQQKNARRAQNQACWALRAIIFVI